jgi:hypothetical protein
MIRTTTIPAIVMVFPDPPEGFTGTAGGKPGAADTAGEVAGAAGAAESCSRGVPQYSQNFLPEATSFPQDVQNGI